MLENDVVARAASYGREVRMAEDGGREQERRQARKAWLELLRELRGTPFEVPARNAHWAAYEGNDDVPNEVKESVIPLTALTGE